MKHETAPLNPTESLELITFMIQQAKGNVQRNRFHYLLWGWVTVLANFGMFILYKLEFEHPYIVWLITIPTWGVSIYKVIIARKMTSASTHLDKISGALWLSYGVVVFTIIAFGSKINFQISPLILLFTAIPTFVSGMILRYNWLKMGGLVFWIGGIICFFLPIDIQPLVAGLAMLSGYLVPGYKLKSTGA
jgi:hypothetical protein